MMNKITLSMILAILFWAGPAVASCLDSVGSCDDVCDPSYYHYAYYASYWDDLPLETASPFWTITDRPTAVEITGRGFESTTEVRLDAGGPREIGRAGQSGMFRDVSLFGSHALAVREDIECICYRDGCSWGRATQSLWSWDLTDPSNPQRLAEISFDGWSYEHGKTVERSGSLALVTTGTLFEILDLQDPAAPQRIGGLDLGSGIADMATTPGMVYLATGSGVSIVRTDPAEQPEVVSVVDWSAGIMDVAASGDRVYATGRAVPPDSGSRLLVIDVSEPDSAFVSGELALGLSWSPWWSSPLSSVATRGDFVFVASGSEGLQVVEVSSSGIPTLIAVVETGKAPTGIRVEGNHAYVALSPSGVQIYDVRDPYAPVLIDREAGVSSEWYHGEAIDVAGDRLVLASNHENRASHGCAGFSGALQLFDVEHPRNPTFEASLAVATSIAGFGSLRTTVILDGYAYAMDENGSLFSIDVSDVSHPALVGSTPGHFRGDMAASDGLVFAVPDSVRVLDVTNPAEPVLASSFFPGFAVRSVAASGRRLFLSGWGPLKVYDVQDAANPMLLGSYPLQGTASPFPWWAIPRDSRPADVTALDDMVYVVERLDNRSHLLVLDARAPGDPVLRGEAWLDPWGPGSIALLDDDHVVVANRRLNVVDVSDPDNPEIVGSGALDLGASDVAVAGSTVYVASGSGEVRAFDLSDPSDPQPAGRVYRAMDGQDYGIAASGDHLFVADGLFHVVRPNPPVRDVYVTAGSSIEFTVPEGFAAGAYDVNVSNTSCPRSGRLENGFLVCARRDLSAVLEPRVAFRRERGSTSWMLRLDGDDGFFEPGPSHEALLLLPDVPEDLEIRYRQRNESGEVSLELRLDPHGETGELRLVASTAEEAEAVWSSARDAGGFVLPRRGDRAYGPMSLDVVPRPNSNAAIPLGRAVPSMAQRIYRYEIRDGWLDRARAVGREADLEIEVTARDEAGCESRATVDVR